VSVFPYLRHFVGSLLQHSDARFRFIATGCLPDQVQLMEDFAADHAPRVTELFVSSESMERHGTALETRDDGDHFCFVDPDIVAEWPFIEPFAAALDEGCAGVTSGMGIWTDDMTVPRATRGSPASASPPPMATSSAAPHFAIYRVALLRATMARWALGIRLGRRTRIRQGGAARGARPSGL
jgi:hypothetical protein